jgi:hypothetical protein
MSNLFYKKEDKLEDDIEAIFRGIGNLSFLEGVAKLKIAINKGFSGIP